ncbi:MAG: GNAT family N-acetyltransferase [Chloroflexi bacterium]|nr:GNAT family N-acetyltransferase [Chloroflexota bacterium]
MIKGNKVRLRAIEQEDIPRFVRWLNDPDVIRFLTIYQPISTADEIRWFQRHLESKDDFVYAIETAEGVHIGNIGLHGMDWKNHNATLGIFIGEKAYWGLGYGTDAILTLLHFAFGEMNLNRVELSVFDYNERAIHSYRKCGFQLEGGRRQALYREGEYHDVLLMSILKSEYEAMLEAAAKHAAEMLAAAQAEAQGEPPETPPAEEAPSEPVALEAEEQAPTNPTTEGE